MDPVEITIKMDALDYEGMCENGGGWSELVADLADEELLERYRNETHPGQVPGRHWKHHDTIGSSRVRLMFARSFLTARGIPHEIVYDAYTWENGEEIGYLILSDYSNLDDPDLVENRRVNALQRAKLAGDELMVKFYMPDAEKEGKGETGE